MSVCGRLEGAIGLRFTDKRPFGDEEVELAQALANQAMLMIQFSRLSAQSREAAVSAERNRIARDAHDTLAQGLTGVIVQLEAAGDATSQGPSVGGAGLAGCGTSAGAEIGTARQKQALRPGCPCQGPRTGTLERRTPLPPMHGKRFVVGLPRGNESPIMYHLPVHVTESHGTPHIYHLNRASKILCPIRESHWPPGAKGHHYQPG
jgi:hypothetical protein